jgi:hypothetical protein
MTSNRFSSAVLAVAAALALGACGGSGGDRARVTVSARANPPAAGAAKASPTTLAVAGGVSIDSVKFVLREIELERHVAGAPGAPAAGGSADDDGTPDQGRGDVPVAKDGADDGSSSSSGEVEVSTGPFLVDLSASDLADGRIVEQFVLSVAEGTYDKLKFRIHHLEDRQTVGDPDFDSRDASIVVKGKLGDGSDFTFRSRLNDDQERRGTFVVGGATPSNITLTIDPSGWFVDAGGAALDPTSEADRQAIEENIRSSIDAFDDHDRDGDDDHGRGGDDDGPNHT